MDFSQEEILRYARHFSVSDIGIDGQKKIKSARVLLIGAGGIGSPAALYLVAAGIGKLGLIDHDTVERSNLQRQILFRETDLDTLKVDAAKRTLSSLNPSPTIVAYSHSLSPENALSIFREYDYILDGSDNYPTRYLVNDAAQKVGKFLISASVFQLGGQVLCLDPANGACYRCLYPSAPPSDLIPNCTQAGVLGVIPGILALLAVNQIFMHLLGLAPAPFFGMMHEFDGKTFALRSHVIPPRPACEGCLSKHSMNITLSASPAPACELKHTGSRIPEISAPELQHWMDDHTPFTLIDVREAHERARAKITPSAWIPLGDFQSASLLPAHPDLFSDPNRTVILYCHAGVRSLKAAGILKNQGFKDVRSLSGGIESWMKHSISKAP
jgi:molybdopterin/thiamine biosynthesis adenylyltransferase/rhodanese-related sulfurtransferase